MKKITKITEETILKMCEDKPSEYTDMVIEAVVIADGYAKKDGGSIVSRQVIANIMLYIDSIYVDQQKKQNI
jgi:hypothetical protein